MDTLDFLDNHEPQDSDFDFTDDDSDYIPSASDDSGDEIQPSPRKKCKKMSSVSETTDTAGTSGTAQTRVSTRRLFNDSDTDTDTSDDEPLASIQRKIRHDSSDDEILADIQRRKTEENELSQLLNEPFWANLPFEKPDVTFHGSQEATPPRLRDPLDYFREMISDNLIENIVYQSNLYSVQRSGRSICTTKSEIDLFIGLYLRMGLIQCYSVRAFWASATRCEKIADHMARDRFQKLASNIHFTDNMADRTDTRDKLWKLRPWLEGLKDSLRKLPQEEHSAVDEVMIPFKGRSSCKQYMKNKPHKWGFKLWGRAGATGTLYEFEIYQGASLEHENTDLTKSSDVVRRLTSNIPDNQNFKVFADNYFTSLPLVEQLKERNIFFVGTVRINRLKGCDLLAEKDLKKSGRGSMDSVVEVNSGCVAVRWYDNRKVDVMSSYIGIKPQDRVQRYDKKNKAFTTISRPAIVAEYNKFMGGIDLHDAVTALYRYSIRSKRWYMYIFYYTINMMVVNAWLRHRKHAGLLHTKSMKLADFQASLATQLVALQPRVGRPSLGSPRVVHREVYRRSIPPRETRLDNTGHLPEYSVKRGRCKQQGCDGFTHFKCSKCVSFLCITKDKNCFARFHVDA